MIKHNCPRDKSFSAQGAGIRTFPRVIPTMYSERRCLRKRFAAHGTEIRPLACMDALMHHVILAMREALAAHVADQRPRPVHRLMRGQGLGGGELLGARVAGIRGHGLGGDRGTAEVPYHGIDDGRDRVRADDPTVVVARWQRPMRFRVMIVQVARLEAHQAPRAGVRLLLADLLMHPPMTFQQGAITKTRLAEIAGERFLHIIAGRPKIGGGRRARGHRGRGMRDLVHLQVAQRDERPRADRARVPRLIVDIVLVLGTRDVTRSHVIVELESASKLEAARGTRIGLGEDLHLIEQGLVGAHGLKMRGE